MAQYKDAKPLRIGLNTDDDPSGLEPGEYTDMQNMRVASSDQEHGQGPAETLQSEIEILINPSTLITYYGQAVGGQFIYQGFDVVQIGQQTWMRKNYSADYPGSKSVNDLAANDAIYGRLYTHNMIEAPDFCPPGWHVPTEAEFDILIAYLGGLMLAGGNLKEVGDSHWTPPNSGAQDIASFRSLPAGGFDNVFEDLGLKGLLWLADDGSPLAPVALNASNVQPFSFDANWQLDGGATGYRLDVATDSGFSSMVSGYDDLDVGNVLTLSITGLTKVTDYFYRVRAYNEIGTSDSSNIIALQTTNVSIDPYKDYGPLYNWYAASHGHISINYGNLYNGFVVNDARNLCAVGWHVPTITEFEALKTELGTNGGSKLKEIGNEHWEQNADATNESGFNARGSGQRYDSVLSGAFRNLTTVAIYWTSSQYDGYDGYGCIAELAQSSQDFEIDGFQTYQYGYSVRPVKDSTILTDGQTGTYTGNDGKVYKTICIGTQEWLSENLAETKYRNGDLITKVTDNTAWAALTTEAYCAYGNDESNAFEYAYDLAPTGWHIPTDDEWITLMTYLGGVAVAGGKLKETGLVHWLTPNTGATNESGFAAIPAGLRSELGSFSARGAEARLWSSTAVDLVNAFCAIMTYDSSQLASEASGPFAVGLSVRPIKDDSNDPLTVTDIDGNIYNTVKIGNQVWFAGNLRTEHYNDGTLIPNVPDTAAWAALITAAMCWYGNNPPVTDDDMKYLQTKDLSAGVTTDVTTTLTSSQEPYNIFVLDTDGNDVTSLVGISIELIGGVWVVHIDTLDEYLGAKIKIIY